MARRLPPGGTRRKARHSRPCRYRLPAAPQVTHAGWYPGTTAGSGCGWLAVFVITWSVPLGLSASPPMQRTAVPGRKSLAAADVSAPRYPLASPVGQVADHLGAVMLTRGAQPGNILRSRFMLGAGKKFRHASRLLILWAAGNGC